MLETLLYLSPLHRMAYVRDSVNDFPLWAQFLHFVIVHGYLALVLIAIGQFLWVKNKEDTWLELDSWGATAGFCFLASLAFMVLMIPEMGLIVSLVAGLCAVGAGLQNARRFAQYLRNLREHRQTYLKRRADQLQRDYEEVVRLIQQ